MRKQKNFFDGAFGRYLLPGVVLQSVLIGGGYATGREIIEYGAKFGALGWIAGLGTFVGFTVVSILTFELARIYKIYDYKSIVKEIAGRGWILFDIIYVLLIILIIAVMASATGTIVEQTLGLNYQTGVIVIIIVVGLLNFYGSRLIEKFETYGTIALYLGYIIFSIIVIKNTAPNIQRVFDTKDTSFVTNVTTGKILLTGIIYVSYNLVVLPSCFFTLKRQTKRIETIISGIIAGILMTIPWFLTYISVMGFYPSRKILLSPIPWFSMMKDISSPIVISILGIIIGWTLIETSTGVIHALIGRINAGLKQSRKSKLKPAHKIIITVIVLVSATYLSKYGIIDLIDKGYTFMAFGFIIIYLLPLLTVGLYKVIRGKPIRKK